MKMRLLIFGFGLMIAGELQAASVLCGPNINNLSQSNCLSTSSFTGADSLTDTLLWTSAGHAYEGPGQPSTEPANNSSSNPANSLSYTGTSTDGDSVTAITVGGGSNAYLARMDEGKFVWAGNALGWVQPGLSYCSQYSYAGGNQSCLTSTSTPYLLTFAGQFDYSTSTATAYGNNSVDANTALLATADLNQPTPIQLTFSDGITQFGVDISALNAVNFTASLAAYDGTNYLGTFYLNATGLGGACASLATQGSAGCNDAPFIGVKDLGPITRIVLNVTDDSNGLPTLFAIDSLQMGGEALTTPEPDMLTLASCGLVALLWWRRRG